MRQTYPHWFADEGKGNLLTECSDIYVKKCRSELAERVKKKTVWQVNCGFCDEPFGVCVDHLREAWNQDFNFPPTNFTGPFAR